MAHKLIDLKIDPRIKLGVIARDKFSGMQGLIVSKIQHLTGCNQWGLTQQNPKATDIVTFYVDEARLEFVRDGLKHEAPKTDLGGPVTRYPVHTQSLKR